MNVNLNVENTFKSLANVVKDTDLYKDAIENIDKLGDEGLTAIEKAQLKSQYLANISNNALNSTFNTALQLEVKKQTLGYDIEKMIKDINIKEQQELAEKIKNGGIQISYIYYKYYTNIAGEKILTDFYTGDGVDSIDSGDQTYTLYEDLSRVKEKVVDLDGTQKSIYEAQREYEEEKTASLELNTKANIVIKAKEGFKDEIRSYAVGGLVVPKTVMTSSLSLGIETASLAGITINSDGTTSNNNTVVDENEKQG